MTDQEYEKELAALMNGEPAGQKKKRRLFSRSGKKWSKKRKVLTAAIGAAVVFAAVSKLFGGSGPAGIPVETQTLAKGDVQEVLSISGPVSGTDSAEVVSRLHAEIQEILVKEGDRVEAGQVLARLDPTDVEKEVEIAQNAYDLAVANYNEAQRDAEQGYAKAVQDQRAAKRDHDRKAMLFASGDISQVEMEAAEDALNDAIRQTDSFNLENGKPAADRSYSLQIKNAEFELEKKKKELEETQVTSPIAGTVVRVNSRVGRFADTVDDDKPLFAVDNLDRLEMKISVSEYSIGKVALGQKAEITADILDGAVEEGIVTAISPTGEEKGGGSTERVIPTTIEIQNPDTKLIAGITARARIVLNEAKDVWVVPVSAVISREGTDYLAAVENNVIRLIPVTLGVEGDVSVEVEGEGLSEGLVYVVSPDASMMNGTAVLPSAS
ncbi:MAG TPA: efflux RND transporter periplasmic adaptor subunit [Candidatus Ventrimonas merdavium]|nr:efflux RND transporter periplasmic adaptor subunit [Candidatus Ventrimonas merdavium]